MDDELKATLRGLNILPQLGALAGALQVWVALAKHEKGALAFVPILPELRRLRDLLNTMVDRVDATVGEKHGRQN